MDKLRRLDVVRLPIADAEMRYLADFISLEEFEAVRTSVTDAGMAQLAGLKNLEVLQMGGEFTDESLEYLKGLKSLRILNLRSATVSTDGLAELQQHLPALQYSKLSYPWDAGGAKPLEIGDPAPDIELKLFDGTNWHLSVHRDKAVLLHFWATWCGPCIKNTDELKQLHEELAQAHGEQFEMLSISLDDKDHRPRLHVETHELTWPQARASSESKIRAKYGVRGVAWFCVVAPDGTVAASTHDWDEIKKAIAESLD